MAVAAEPTPAVVREPAPGMVEKRGSSLWLTHALMIFGVLIVFFPIWLAFVASTITQQEIAQAPMPIWPGEHFIENYTRALFAGVNVPVATMLMNSLIMALGIAIGKIIISLLSAFAIVYFRFPGPEHFLLDDLHHTDVAG
jgi:sn-glycerol 3-phosphate transport system permease protein